MSKESNDQLPHTWKQFRQIELIKSYRGMFFAIARWIWFRLVQQILSTVASEFLRFLASFRFNGTFNDRLFLANIVQVVGCIQLHLIIITSRSSSQPTSSDCKSLISTGLRFRDTHDRACPARALHREQVPTCVIWSTRKENPPIPQTKITRSGWLSAGIF